MKPKLLLLFLGATLVLTTSARAQRIDRVSVSSNQAQASGGSSSGAVSADGHFVAFESTAPNLVDGDTNASSDVFVHDARTGATARVSVATGGAQANASSFGASMSADGRYVCFSSGATNLVTGDTNARYDVFVHDRDTDTTVRASLDAGGNQSGGNCTTGSISADGRFVAFVANGSLAPNDLNGAQDVYVRDLQAGTTVLASAAPSGNAGNFFSSWPSISGDGRYVAFESSATDLVVGDTNGVADVFVRDMQLSTTLPVTVDPNWVIGNLASHLPSISADGRYVALESDASNLVSGDTNGARDVFVRDLQTQIFARANVDSAGSQSMSPSSGASLAADGRRVAFESAAADLVSGDTNGVSDVFVRDLDANTTARVTAVLREPNGQSRGPKISPGGALVAFWSDATNLIPIDDNAVPDVFLFDPDPCGGFETYCTAKVNSQGCIPEMCAEGSPSYSGADDFHVTGRHVLNNKSGMLLWSYGQDNRPFGGGILCVDGPFRRTPLQNSGGSPGVNDCTGFYSFWFSHAYMASKGIPAGAVIFAQYWSRDPFFAPPNNVGLTNGIEFTVEP